MPITITVEGLRELKAALDELPKATARNVQQRVLLRRAQPIVAAAKAKVPVRTGALRNAIRATTTRPRGSKPASGRAFAAAGGGAAGRAAAKAAGASAVEVFIGPVGRLPQAGQQEWGNKNHPPHAYLRPAWDEGKEAVAAGIKADMWIEIQKAAARRAKRQAKLGR
jgi:HK97 gp10 family phage protein